MNTNFIYNFIQPDNPLWHDQKEPQLPAVARKLITHDLIPGGSTYCSSRTLKDVASRVFYNYSYHTINASNYLLGLLNLYLSLSERLIHYNTVYINADFAADFTSNNISSTIYHNEDANIISLNFVAVGKNYSVVRTALDSYAETNQIQRFKTIENANLNDSCHFLRIYKDIMPNAKGITIYSNQWSQELIWGIILTIPLLYNLNVTPEALQAEDPTIKDNALKLQALLQIFKYLYDIAFNPTQANISLTEINEQFIKLTNTYLNLFDFQNNMFSTFFNNLIEKQITNLKQTTQSTINTYTSYIQDYERRLLEYYTKRREAQLRQIALNTTKINEIKVIAEQIKRNPSQIELLESNINELILRITVPLRYFNSSDFECYERNSTSTLNQTYANKPKHKQILHEILITKRYQILIQSIICLKCDPGNTLPLTVRALTNSEPNITQYKTTIQNPHLYYHDCWSEARTEIKKALTEENYELIIPQILCAVQSINVAEGATFVNRFLPDFKNPDYEDSIIIIDTKTNEQHTLKELLEKPLEEALPQEKEYTQIVLNEEEITDAVAENIANEEGEN